MERSSIWPFDYLRGEYPVPSFESVKDEDADIDRSFKVFVLCPQKPEDNPELLMGAVEDACQRVREGLRGAFTGLPGPAISISVDRFPGAGAIHSDLWRGIRDRDVVVADITGENPNVMFELGVAAAIKPERQVIIVAKRSNEFRFRFDLQPLRHRFYESSPMSDGAFRDQLAEDILLAVLSLPFYRRPIRREISIPCHWDFTKTDSDDFFASTLAHRAAAKNGLEFGSWSFPYGWLCVGNIEPRDVLVRMRFRFIRQYAPSKDGGGWCGVALRAASVYAKYSQLFYLRMDGLCRRTVPKHERLPHDYFDHDLTAALVEKGAEPASSIIELEHGVNQEGQLVGINGVRKFFRRGDPSKGFYNRDGGKILLQTWLCLVQIERVDLLSADNLESMSTLPVETTDDSHDAGFP